MDAEVAAVSSLKEAKGCGIAREVLLSQIDLIGKSDTISKEALSNT